MKQRSIQMSDRKTEETNAREIAPDVENPRAGLPAMSRRRFLSSTAIGAAGLALSLNTPESLFAQQDNADVTLDAILITLLSAPIGSTGTSTWTVTQTFSSTFTLRAEANLSLTTSASVTNSFGTQITGTFSVGSSETFSQSASVQVADAIRINRTISLSVTTPSPGVVGNTVFVGIQSPKVNFKGDPTRLLWKFINNSVGGLLLLTVSDLQSGVWSGVVKPSTRDSWLAQYPLLTDPTGSTLVKPRYKKRYTINVSPGVSVNFSVETADGSSFTTSKTASISAEITDRTSFTSGGLNTTFSVGNRVSITLTSVQELSSNRIIRFSTVLQRTTPGTFIIYKDRVLKTWLVVDAGAPVTSGQPVVRGVVNSSTGAVAGALVELPQGTHTYLTAADGTGNYVLATSSLETMSTGTYSIITGSSSQSVTVGSGTTYSNFYGVDRTAATSPYSGLETAAMTE
jgi:trimeric autotransporter adhesin